MQRNRSAHTACILPNRRDIVNSRKLFSNKNRKWFFHSDRLFSLLPLKNPLRKHTSFGKSLTAWRNLAATQIFLFLFRSSKCNAFFCLDYVSPNKNKKRKKDISDTLLSFFFKWIKPENFQFRISKTTCARGCKFSKHERILSHSIFGTLHRRRFHLSLARKPTSSFPRSCYLGRIWRGLTYLAVCLYFFPVKLQFNRTLSEIHVFVYIIVEKKC